ncbi:HigA family addiction module antitoxin [Pelagibaculum spongiae]|uniref:Addiction module antidote protein, HigA family n=1 Tax=Pelagibaculum spongiae TaxID=2080658 RepID=A0A2V1GVK1_9GAMM|nr:HigA family addiction module antitoxin [Pelagibaculum spongiae]PVZ70358.1 addiction module antidote protein, HigA family [Pelagibaculum spongiae]
MSMHNPPHPGEFIDSIYMEPYDISCRYLAAKLGVAASTLNRVIKGKSAVSPEMALRLSKVLGRTPESWLSMQDNYEIWQAKKRIDTSQLKPLNFITA